MTPWWVAAAVATLVSVAAEIVWHGASHAYFWWHRLPGFDAMFGLAGCVAIVILSKALGAWWLQRPERYWEEEG